MSEQERFAFWTKALNLPEFRVVHEHRDTPAIPVRFTVFPSRKLPSARTVVHACDHVHRATTPRRSRTSRWVTSR